MAQIIVIAGIVLAILQAIVIIIIAIAAAMFLKKYKNKIPGMSRGCDVHTITLSLNEEEIEELKFSLMAGTTFQVPYDCSCDKCLHGMITEIFIKEAHD